MKRIVMSLATILVVGSIAAGATWAYFTSNKTLSGSTLSTGTLTVNLTGNGDSKFDLGTVQGLEPGGETDEATIVIRNTGSLNLAWFGYFNFSGYGPLMDKVYIKEAKMEFLRPNATEWEPMDYFISDGVGSGSYPTFYNQIADADPIDKISLTSWNNANAMGAGGGVQMGALKPNHFYRMTFQLALDGSADNSFQGKTLGMSYSVASTQIMAEALDDLFTSNSRLGGVGSNHLTWLEAQIAKQ